MSVVKSNALQIGQSLTATNNFSWYQPSSPDGTVRLGVGNAGATTSDVLVANSSGNVGIGTSSPSTKLNIVGDNNNAYFQSSTGTAATYSRWSNSGGSAYIGLDNSAGSALGLAYALHIQSPTSVALHVNGSGSVAALLDSSGNLGLGVTPSAWGTYSGVLEFAGGGNIEGYSTGFLGLGSNHYYNGSNFIYKISSYASRYAMDNTGKHIWYNAPSGTAGNAISFTQAMTLDASGNLLVGGTSFSTVGKITVGGFGDGVSFGQVMWVSASASGGNAWASYYYNSSGTQIGGIRLSSTATAYNTSSDQRLKENIADAPTALNSVNAIKVRSFDWKLDGSHVDYGYIAQELLEVVPEAVSVPADPDEMMGVDFGKLTPRLVKAIQELSAQVTTLQAEINALKA